MGTSGRATENDIEMVLLAFSEDELQYYIPFDEEQHLSKAIKSNVTFWNKKDPAILYRWDDQIYTFQVV